MLIGQSSLYICLHTLDRGVLSSFNRIMTWVESVFSRVLWGGKLMDHEPSEMSYSNNREKSMSQITIGANRTDWNTLYTRMHSYIECYKMSHRARAGHKCIWSWWTSVFGAVPKGREVLHKVIITTVLKCCLMALMVRLI